MKRVLLAGTLLLGSALRLNAGVGIEAAPFLKIDAGARAAALGGAYTALGDDAAAIFYNPAGAGLLARKELLVSHNAWIADLRNEHAAYVQPENSGLAFFLGLDLLLTPDMDKYDLAGGRDGSFSAGEGALSAGAAWALKKDLYGAIAVKDVWQRADNRSASAYALDLGLVRDYGKLRFGASAQNLGTKMKLYKQSSSLPATYRGGAAYKLADKFWVSADVLKAGESAAAVAAGTEIGLAITRGNSIFGRVGYRSGRTGDTGAGISSGLGLSLRGGDLRFDYSFSPYGGLGAGQRLTLSFRFGEAIKDAGDKAAAREQLKEKAAPPPEEETGSYSRW